MLLPISLKDSHNTKGEGHPTFPNFMTPTPCQLQPCLLGNKERRCAGEEIQTEVPQGLSWGAGVQWLRLQAAHSGDMGLIPGQGTKIPSCCGVWPKKIKKKNKTRSRSSKMSKRGTSQNSPHPFC